MRCKQNNIHPYNNVIPSLDFNTRSDVVQWILTSRTKPGFTAVDVFVTQYYMKLVCTAFYYGCFDVYCLHKFSKYIPYKLSIEKQRSIVDARGLDLHSLSRLILSCFI